MNCPECRQKNREEAIFCNYCGQQLKLVCPDCGSENLLGSQFCDQCGHKLKTVSVKEGQGSPLTSERKNVTILFSDMSGYTAMTERLDPEEVRDLMSRIFGEIAQVIAKYEGFIERFIGDSVMAIFGVPNTHEDDPIRAIKAAMEIHSLVEALSPQFEEKIDQKLAMHTGINTGLVVTGEVDVQKGTHGITGDSVNLASRLESLARRGEILVGEQTYRQAKGYFTFESLEPLRVKGKLKRQYVYALKDFSNIHTRFEVAVSKGLVPFVGRINSMGTISDVWNRATDGFGQVLGIKGEPGVGKSRLILQFIHSLGNSDFEYLHGRCMPHGRQIAYLPFIDILKSIFRIKEDQREHDIRKNATKKIARLGSNFPATAIAAIQQLLSIDFDDESWQNSEPQLRKKHIFETLKGLILYLSKDRPLVMVVDDLQWIDRTSEEFLSHFINSMDQHPIFLILLFRPEYRPPWGERPHFDKLRLGQLRKESGIKLISAILKNRRVAAELENFIFKQTEGNPLFIEELIYNLLEKNYIKREKNKVVMKHGFARLKIPGTIQGIVADRLDKLSATHKRILQVASVIGHDFGYYILQSVVGMGDELQLLLNDLQRLEFVCQKGGVSELEFTFKHALIQEVVYSSLLFKQRRKLHSKIGGGIEKLHAQKLDEFNEILAYHYSLGKDYNKAYHYLKLSGKKAESNFSHKEAFSFFKRALKIIDKLSDKKIKKNEKLEIHNLMRLPSAMLGYPTGSLGILEAGVKIAEKVGDQKALARFYNNISILHTARGNSRLSIANSEKSFQEAHHIGDIEMMAPVALSLCYAYVSTCQYEKLINISLTITSLIEDTENEAEFFNTPFNLYSFALSLCGMALGIRGEFKKGKRISENGLRNAQKIGQKATLAFSELQHANLLILKGEGRAAIPYCQNSIKHSEDTVWLTILSQAWTVLSYANYLIGNFEEARRFVAEGLKIQEDSGIEAMLSMHYWIFSLIHFSMDKLEDARKCAKKALKLSKKNKEKRYEGLSKIMMGRILGSKRSRKYKEGEQVILNGHSILEELNVRPAIAQGFLNLGELYINSGQSEKAIVCIEKALSMFEEMGMDHWSVKARETLQGI